MFVDDYNPTCRSQYERMIRWYKRLEGIDYNYQNKLDEYLDIAYAFFMNCYHLKDWIINDPNIDLPRNGVEEYVNFTECLFICADICNGSKHLRLDNPRSEKEPKIGLDSFYDTALFGERSRRYFFYLETKDGIKDPLTFAEECVTSWEVFIQVYNIL